MKRVILKHMLALAATLGLLCGWLVVEATAQVYLSYASGSEMLLVVGTASTSGVTQALQNYPGRTLVVYDTTGKTATAEIKGWSAGSIEFGSEIVTNGGFELTGATIATSWTAGLAAGMTVYSVADPKSGTSAQAIYRVYAEANSGIYQSASLSAGTLYRRSVWYKRIGGFSTLANHGVGTVDDAGSLYPFVDSFVALTSAATTDPAYINQSSYGVPTVSKSYYLRATNAGWYDYGTLQIDDFSIKPVTSPGSNGVRLGPVTMESGFNPNTISYWQIQAPPSDPRSTRRLKGNAVVFDSRCQ